MPTREDELLVQIAALARSLGLGEEGAQVAVAIAMIEGGLSGAVGDQGQSFGIYQLHKRGQLPAYAQARGLTVEQAGEWARTDPLDAAKWALQTYLGGAIKAGQKQGLSGAALATYAQRYGQRSVSPEKAGQQYTALGQGGSNMPDPTTNNPFESDEYKGYEQAYTKEIEATLKALRGERDALLGEYREWSASLGVEWNYEAEQYVALLRQRINAVDTMIRQTQAGLSSASNKAIDKYMAAQSSRLTDAIAVGNLSQRQAEFEWDKVMDQTTAGINGIIQGYASLRSALPQMGTQSMADAAKALMLNWRALGVNIPDFDLPVVQFDPLDEIRKRLPPATDWKQAMAGGGGASGGGSGVGMQAPVTAPSPPMAAQPLSAPYAQPPGYAEAPPMPESLMGEPWRGAMLGAAGMPGPSGSPYIGRGGGFPEGDPSAVIGVPQAESIWTRAPWYGAAPARTATPAPSPTPSLSSTPSPSPTPAAGESGTLTPAQQTALDGWRKRNPKATLAQQETARQAALEGLLR